MSPSGTLEPQRVLLEYLDRQRQSVVWKVEGLSEHDARRPLTDTGTNLLGLVKHLASVELEYFGECLGRPTAVDLPWLREDADDNEDLWCTPEESRDFVLGLYETAAMQTAEAVRELGLDAIGHVLWWPEERNRPTVQTLLVHMIQETARHAGHADILREQLDGRTGIRPGVSNLPDDGYDWPAHVARVQAAADAFR